MVARLKVFTWSDGFHAYTVATPSRAKALAAWGLAGDLFKDGRARQIDAGPDFEAALAKPGVTVQRGLAVDVGKSVPRRAAKPAAAPSRADVARVKSLQARIAALSKARRGQLAALDRQRQELETRAAAQAKAYEETDRDLQSRLRVAERKLAVRP